MSELFLGADIGGTSTRVVVADGTGRQAGRGDGPGGNPVAHPRTAREAFEQALRQALAGLDPARVRAGVLGMAGGGALRDPVVRAAYDEVWRAAGLSGRPQVRPDLEVAYAAGTDCPDGTVLVAGTGAVAGTVRERRLTRTVGGHGWLLGDEGAGCWVGREAVRAVLRVEDGLAGRGVLVDAVLEHYDLDRAGVHVRDDLIAAVHARPPVHLAELSPLVEQAHRAGDRAATQVLERAAEQLLALWAALATGDDSGPVVLAGSLTSPDRHVGSLARAGLATSGVEVLTAQEPVRGAVRLAASLDRK